MYITYKKYMNNLEQITAILVANTDNSISTCALHAAQIIKECANIEISPLNWKSVESPSKLILHFSQGGGFKIEEWEVHAGSSFNKNYILFNLNSPIEKKISFNTLDAAKQFAEFLRVR